MIYIPRKPDAIERAELQWMRSIKHQQMNELLRARRAEDRARYTAQNKAAKKARGERADWIVRELHAGRNPWVSTKE